MRASVVSIWLREMATGELVEASVVGNISADEFAGIATSWSESKADFRKELEGRGADPPENDSWDWGDKAATTTSWLHRFLGVATDEMQGMMMLATVPQQSRKPGREREQVLYVEYLESAPWNIPEYAGEDVRYRRVGMSLLAAAVAVSVDLGCDGRLALHSLSGSRRFYEKAGFERVGFDEEENLEWYELSGVTMNEGAANGSA